MNSSPEVIKKVKAMEARMHSLEQKLELLMSMLAQDFGDDFDEFEDPAIPLEGMLREHANFETRQNSEFN